MDQYLPMVGFFIQGEALSWFKWLHNNNLLTNWHSFTQALELCFGLSTYINHQVELFKLQQTTSVTESQGRFERLCNCIVGLNSLDYIYALRIKICRDLTLLNSYFIAQTIGLARLIEDKLRDSKPKQNCFPVHYHHPTTTSSIINKPKGNTFTPPLTLIPIKCLSSSQM